MWPFSWSRAKNARDASAWRGSLVRTNSSHTMPNSPKMSTNRPAISATNSRTSRPCASAASLIFRPFSSVPATKNASSPRIRKYRAVTSPVRVVSSVPIWGVEFTYGMAVTMVVLWGIGLRG